MPDSIEGCVECNVDSDCDYGNICEVQWNKCVPKPDPCNPSPCGPGANCMEDYNGNAVCRFLIPEIIRILLLQNLLIFLILLLLCKHYFFVNSYL